jgi:hypothetical protein
MVCYNPTRCRHVSNCSQVTQCDSDEHQLTLLDQTVYSTLLDAYCHILTCCELRTVDCLPTTIAPTMLSTTALTTTTHQEGESYYWKLIIGCASGLLVFCFFVYWVYKGIRLYSLRNTHPDPDLFEN